MQANIAKRTGNGYTAWRDVTPQHNRLVDRILQCNMHIAATLRTKTEYVIEDNAQGKKAPRKVGMAPVFREGFEYESPCSSSCRWITAPTWARIEPDSSTDTFL